MQSITRYFFTLINIMLVSLFVSACNQENQTAQITDKKASKTFARTAKPHAEIYMQYKLPDTLEAGQPISVEITLLSGAIGDKLTLDLRTGEGLETADPLSYAFGPQQPEQKNTIQLIVQAEADGQYRLYLTAGLVNGTQTQSRSFIIPINIGKAVIQNKAKAVGVIIEENSGEKVISMPATETSD